MAPWCSVLTCMYTRVDSITCAGIRAQNTRGTGVEQRVLEALLAKRLPKVATHLAAAETPLADVSAAWFHSLFASALPAETVVRVWDVLLLEGPKILFRVALALFKVPHPCHPLHESVQRGPNICLGRSVLLMPACGGHACVQSP